ncbi:hypothetical protein QL093DRAFT_2122128 [Fusarium oxysporum]|nr:hypothetical protein QL093DRAFT_2122128 [Fusarium oxysporum]
MRWLERGPRQTGPCDPEGLGGVLPRPARFDPEAVAEAINTLAQQGILFKNEVEAAQRPRDGVEDLLRQMGAQLGGINTRLRILEGSVNRMEATHHKPFPPFFINICRTSATRNVRARASNARVTETVTALTPLANPETGEDIPNFPRINGDAQELNIRELGALLEVLGVRCNRTAERKRAAFFNAIGTTLMAH